MHRTTAITAITERFADGCLGDAEFLALQAELEDLAPQATRAAGGELYAGEPPY